jgi:hypothetical protein
MRVVRARHSRATNRPSYFMLAHPFTGRGLRWSVQASPVGARGVHSAAPVPRANLYLD